MTNKTRYECDSTPILWHTIRTMMPLHFVLFISKWYTFVRAGNFAMTTHRKVWRLLDLAILHIINQDKLLHYDKQYEVTVSL